MNWGRCTSCAEYGYLPHGCVEFEIAMEDKRSEPYWSTLYARDMELAAEKFADRYDCEGDYTIVRAGDGGEFYILVRKPEEPDTMKRFHVYGESVPQYHAREVDALGR